MTTYYQEHAKTSDINDQPRWKPAECLRQVKADLRIGKQSSALTTIQQSLVNFPNVPILLSYYGLLLVLVRKRYRIGIETCRKAIEKQKREQSFHTDTCYPEFYCNLGKAYAAAGKRKEALEALRMGLAYDSGNCDIKAELLRLGLRRKSPAIPFLDRSNPLNKYLGLMLHRKLKDSNTSRKN